MAARGFRHESVLAREVVELLQPKSGDLVLDGTLGGGGHARLILEASSPDGRLIGLDRDPEALAAATEWLQPYAHRIQLRPGNFAQLADHLEALGVAGVDGLLLDLGVSSHQLDCAERGFSFREDGPLDMRMDPTSGLSAAEFLAEVEEKELKRVLRDFGEERWAGRIAREIVQSRGCQPLSRTAQLADLVSRVVPRGRGPQRIHPATRVFQALRIEVNHELDALAAGLDAGLALLNTGGRMAVISFHSLEDRIVKHRFRAAGTGCTCPPRLAVCVCGRRPRFKVLTRRGIRADEAELQRNPRARSAVLRGIERLSEA